MKNGTFLHPQRQGEQETYTLKLFKRVRGNTAYEYADAPTLYFKGRPANRYETKSFRIIKGVTGSANSITIICSNLPKELEIDDRVEYLGKIMLVKNIGYVYGDNGIENAGLFSNDYIFLRSPKGITLG